MEKCCCDEYASPIDEVIAQRDRDAYHEDGPDKPTGMLLDMVRTHVEPGATLLDIGGGIGVIDLELLRDGASKAVLVEASPPYIDAARQEARAAGLADRLTIEAGDFVRRADAIDAADIVTLDKVICCYRDVESLVARSAEHAIRLYALVLPRDRWYVRLATRLENVLFWLKRDAYRAYAHANDAIDAQLESIGLTVRSEAFTPWWRVALFERRSSPQAPGPAVGDRGP